MNSNYKLVYSEILNTWVAVAEHVSARGKKSALRLVTAAALMAGGAVGTGASWAAPPLITPPAVNQLPTGAQVAAGTVSFSQTLTATAASMAVQQSSNQAIVNWQSFNVGANAKVNITQPNASSVLLNRVQSSDPSQIFGQINANGQVLLLNPNGVYFAPGSRVDVGSFTASTHSISDADFLNGQYRFNRNGATGSILNEGTITSGLGGYIALLAPEVRNQGVVVAQMGGTVALAAGESFELQFNSNKQLTNVLVTPATIQTLVDNGQAVQAPGGLIILSAQAASGLLGGVVKNSGAISATGLVNDGGTIRLSASHRIELAQTSSIRADAAPGSRGNGGRIDIITDLNNASGITQVDGTISAKGGEQGGDGGFVDTSAAMLAIGENTLVTMGAAMGNAGTWLLDPYDVTIAGPSDTTSGTAYADSFTAGETSTILASTISNSLNAGSNVSISTGSASENTIFVNSAITATTGAATLTLTGGSINLAANITTIGSQTYNGAVVINKASGITLASTNSNVNFASTVNSYSGTNYALTINNGTGATSFTGAVGATQNIGELTLNGTGTITLGGNVTTTGNQSYGGAVNAADGIAITANATLGPTTIVTNGNNNNSYYALGVTGLDSSSVLGAPYYVVQSGSSSASISTTSNYNVGIMFYNNTGTLNGAGSNNAWCCFNYPILVNAGQSSVLNSISVVTRGDEQANRVPTSVSVYGSNTPFTSANTVTQFPSSTLNSSNLSVLGSGYQQSNFSLIGSGSLSFAGGGAGRTPTASNTIALSNSNTYQYYLLAFTSPGGSLDSAQTGATSSYGRGLALNAINLYGQVHTPSSVTFNSAVTAAGALTVNTGYLSATSIATSGSLTMNNSGVATITGAITNGTANGSVIQTGTGTTTLSGTNTYTGTTTISAGTIKAASAAALGTGAVSIGASGKLDLTFGGTVALGSSLSMSTGATITNSANTSSLSVAGASTLAGSINTAGNQTYSGAVTLGANTSLTTLNASSVNTNGNVTFGATVNSASGNDYGLTVSNDTGTTSFGGVVGGTNPLGYLCINAASCTATSAGTASGNGTTNLSGDVMTSGTQTYGGNLTLGANTSLTSTANGGNGAVTIAGSVNSTSVSSLGTGIIEFLGSGYWGVSTTNGSSWAFYESGSSSNTYQSSISIGSASYTSTLAQLGTVPSILYSSGNYSWNPATTATVSYLVVGGGGGGSSGGGGGGGVLQSTSLSASSAVTYTITVGAGGAGSSSIGTLNGTNGGNSSITGSGLTSVIAYGGGGGSRGAFQTVTSGSAGSSGGGGGSQSTPASPGGAAIYGSQGFAGGANNNASFTAGGGGGAGSVGGAGTSTSGGSGGSGVLGNITTSLSATTSNYFGGGGGGGTYYGTSGANIQGTGGSGGGASSGKTTTNPGITNSGGGGGGQCFTSCSGSGGAGGSGIVALSGTLLDSFTQSVYSLTINSGTGKSSIGGSVSNVSTLTINSTSSLSEITGVIGGSTALSKSGAGGALTLSGANTYTGGTTISAGSLKMGHATALGGSSGAVLVADGAALDLNGTTLTNTNALTLNGTGISSGGALTNSSSTAATYAGNIALGSASSIGSAVGGITASGVVSGAFALTKVGAAALILTGSNTHTGTTTISAGTLRAGHNGALGNSGGGAISVTSGAALDLNGFSISNVNTLTLNGTGISNTGALTNSSPNGSSFQGPIVLGSDSSIGANTFHISLINTISGAFGLNMVGSYTVNLSGNNTYTGLTRVSGGILNISSAQALGDASSGTTVESGAFLTLPAGVSSSSEIITLNSGSTLFGASAADTSWSGNITLAGNSSVRANVGRQLTLSGVVSGPGRLEKREAGTVVLTGTNTYGGGTLVTLGTLQLGAGGATGSIEGNVTNNGTLAFNRNDDLTYANVISGTGAVTKLANNTLTFTGTNTYAGGTTISAGTLQLGDGNTSGVISGNVTNNATLVFNRSDALNFSGAISGTGAVSKLGTGTTTLSGINTYTGLTTVSTGTLAIGNADGLGGTAAGTTVANGATLDLQGVAVGAEAITLQGGTLATTTGTSSLSGAVTLGADSTINVAGSASQLTLSGLVTGARALTKSGTGKLIMSNQNTFSGGMTIAAGTATEGTTYNGSSGPFGSGTVTVQSGATLDLNNYNVYAPVVLAGGALLNNATSGGTGQGDVSLGVSLTADSIFGGAGYMNAFTAITSNGHGLVFLGTGTKNLSSTSNTLSTIATGTGVGVLNVVNNQAMAIGQVAAGGSTYSGIDSTGTVSVVTRTGDLAVSQNVVTTSTVSDYTTPALKLGAGSLTAAGTPTGGDVVLSGTPTVSVGTGGVALIYSGYATTSAARTLNASFAPKLTYYSINADSTYVPTVQRSAYFTLFRESPATLYTLYLPNQRFTYGTPITSLNYCYSTSASSCVPVTATGVPSTTQVVAANGAVPDVGIYPLPIALPLPDVTGYFFVAGNAVNIYVDPKPVTIANTAQTTTYNGLSTYSNLANAMTYTVSGLVGYDAVRSLTQTPSGSGLVASQVANAGSFTVTPGSVALSTGKTSNYTFSYTAATATVDKANLTVTAKDDSKFIGEADVSGFAGVRYTGFVAGQTASVLSGAATVARSNASMGAAGTYAGVLSAAGSTLSSNNYNLIYEAGNYTIVPADQLLIRLSDASTTYGTAPSYTLSSVQYKSSTGSSVVDLTSRAAVSTGAFTLSDGAGGNTALTLGPVAASLSSAGQVAAGSYQVGASSITNTSANYGNTVNIVGALTVEPKTLTPEATSGLSKVYDGTTSMSSLGFGLTGVVGADAVRATGVGTYANANAGNAKSFTVSGIGLSGTDAANYKLAANTLSATNGVITTAPLQIKANNDSKTYDASAYAATAGVSYSGFVNGETAADLGGTLAYSGTAIGAVNVGNYVITPSGQTSSNYAISFGDGALNISPADVRVSATNVALTGTVGKEYDGTNVATLSSGNYVITGWQGSDGANITQTIGTYDNANAGTNKLVSVRLASSDFSATNGTLLSNYNLPTAVSGNVGVISPKTLTVTANNATKTYDGTAYTGGNGVTYAGFVNSETVAALSGTLIYEGTSQGARNAASYAITPAGLTSSNYAVNFADGTLTISPAGVSAIAVNLTGSTAKVYDGNTAATLTPGNFALTGFAAGEGASVSKTTGTFDNANAGTGKTVTATLSNSDFAATGTTVLSNYALPTSASGAIGSITRAPLNATLMGTSSKVYDGSTAATLAPGNFALTGFVNVQGASISKTTGTFDTASEGTGKTVTTTLSSSDFAATGTTQLSNYTLPTSASGAIGTITPAPVAPEPVAPAPVTPAPVTPAPVAPAPVTPAPVTPAPVTPAPVTPAPVTPAPVAPAPVAPAPVAPAPVPPAPVTPAPVTPAPVAPAPVPPVVVVIPPSVIPVSAQSVAPPLLTVSTVNSATTALPAVSAGPSSATVSSSSGVSVSTINSPSVQVPGLVAVLVPAGTATAGSGLVIALPEQVVTPAEAGGTVQVTLPNNQPLPDWIRYDAATQTLVTSAVPAGAFPLSVLVTVGGQTTVIQISESHSSP